MGSDKIATRHWRVGSTCDEYGYVDADVDMMHINDAP
jgi:hypothetical protein